MIKKIKKKISYFRENVLILLWHLMEYLDLIGTTISIILIAFLISGCILIANGVYIECKENISIAFQVFLLVAPFLIGLAFEFWFCKYQYNKLLISHLENNFYDSLFEMFSSILEFLVLIGIAFLVFLKGSIYERLKLDIDHKLTADIFLGWLISACVVVRTTFTSAYNSRRAQ